MCVRERMKFDGAGAQRIEQKRKKGATYLPPSSIWWSPKKGWSVEERMMKRTPLFCASGRQRNVTLCRPVLGLVRIANPIGRTGRTNWLNRHCMLPAVCRVGVFLLICTLCSFSFPLHTYAHRRGMVKSLYYAFARIRPIFTISWIWFRSGRLGAARYSGFPFLCEWRPGLGERIMDRSGCMRQMNQSTVH